MDVMEAHPLASFVADEMLARDWTCVDVAQRMGGDYSINVGVMNFFLVIDPTKLVITDDLINGLSAAFGISEGFFERLHKMWLDNPDHRVTFDCPEILLGGIEFPQAEGSAPETRVHASKVSALPDTH